MNKAAVGKAVGVEKILALSTAMLVAVVITLAALLIAAAPSTAPSTSGRVGYNPPAVGAGGEHYGERWNDYGHADAPSVVGAGGEHYGEGWDNYGR